MARWKPLRLVLSDFNATCTELLYEPIKLQKHCQRMRRVCTLKEVPFFRSLSPTVSMNTYKNISLYIFTAISTKVIGKFKSSEHYLHKVFALTRVCQQRGVCDPTGRGSGRGLLRRLSRDHMVCVCSARSCACVRACLLALWSSGRAEAVRLGIVSSLLPSLPLSLLLSRYNILAAAT